MSVRGTLGGVFTAGAVLVIGWQAGAAAHQSATTAASGTATSGSVSGGVAAAVPSPSASSANGTAGSTGTAGSGTAGSGLKDGTYTGAATDTQYGPVQVRITVASGRVSTVTALQLTNRDPRSVQISNRAAPALRQEVLAAQSASVGYVSGATYTSDGYLRSVQSALDQAKA